MKTLLLLALLAGALPVQAAPAPQPRALSTPFASLWKAGRPVEIPVGQKINSETVDVPALPKPPAGTGLVLRFQARLHTPSLAGWNNFLGLRWNGVPISDVTSEGKPRLLNRGRTFRSSIPSEASVDTFHERAGLPNLALFFGPDFQTLDSRVLTDRDEGYWYLLDLAGLDTAAPARLDFVNTALAMYFGEHPAPDLRIVVDSLEIGQVPAAAIEALRSVELIRRRPVSGTKLRAAGAEVSLAPGGGLQFARGKEYAWFESLYQGPGESAKDASWLAGTDRAPAGARWRSEKGRRVFEAAGRGFRLRREVATEAGRLVVSDTLTNQTDRPLGVRVRQRLLIPGFLKSFRFAGVEGQRSGRAFGWPDNPTLYVAQGASGLGFLAEDDFFRLHMGGDASGNALDATDEHFGLGPKESYTFRFALYPTGGDFWDFLNAARRDWKVNFTVQGPFAFTGAQAAPYKPQEIEARRAELQRLNTRIFALSPWFEYYSGYGITRDAYKAMMQNTMKMIRQIRPDAICIPLTETNLVPVPLTFFEGKLPADFGWGRENGGAYGKEAPPEAAAVLDASPWKDSVVRGEHGRPILDTWYVQYYGEPKGLNLIVYPTLTNHRHQQMLEQLRWLLDDVGFDGVYIDQFAMALGGADSLTYGASDGHTVDLDPATGEVTRQYAVVGKISAPARREWVEFVLKRKKLVVANGQPVVGEMQSLPINRFMETQGYDVMGPGIPNATMCARGMLASPIGLGHSFGQLTGATPGRSGEVLMRTIIAQMRYGLLYYNYGAHVPAAEGGYGPLNHMFPFTPVELHEGWMVGRERILTCRSRTFSWPGARPPKVLLFDKRGMEKPTDARVEKTAKGYQVSVKLEDWAEVAVIE